MIHAPGRIRAVLYDFDGTLADSTDLIMRCYRHTMRTHLGRVPPDEDWLSGFGMTLEAQLRRFARHEDEFVAMVNTYRAHQREHHDRMLRPFPGVLETTEALAGRGYALAIVTSKARRGALQGVELCGLTHHFSVIVTPEDVVNPKPSPDPVLIALERLGVSAEESIFVGDSPHDMVSGKAAGTRVAGALWGPFPREALEREQPDWLLEQPRDVLRILE